MSMPFWAFLHFYIDEFQANYHKELCQCPSGLSFISTDCHFVDKGEKYLVSMPFWDLLHFYLVAGQIDKNGDYCVNALLGFPSFLQCSISLLILMVKMCQCPSGLSFISTASFWNPQKQSIFQAFFAGIYLKILKIRFFRLFFVLFTICSYFNTNHSCT